MNIAPATPPAAGEETPADRAWACDFISGLLGRPVSGGLNVDRLAAKLATERAHTDAPAVPEPRPAWRDIDVRGGAHR